MRKTLLILFTLFAIIGAKAQQRDTFSRDSFVKEFLLGDDPEATMAELEKGFQAYGIDCKTNAFYDENDNAFTWNLEFFDKNLFDKIDTNALETIADNGVNGMLKEFLSDKEDYAHLVDGFTRFGIKFRLQITFTDNNGLTFKREAVRTPTDIKTASKKLKNK